MIPNDDENYPEATVIPIIQVQAYAVSLSEPEVILEPPAEPEIVETTILYRPSSTFSRKIPMDRSDKE